MKLIKKYFPEITQKKSEQLYAFYNAVTEFNAQINIISRKDIENLEERHILHSLAIAKFLNFKPETKILDVGTGGGLPGIPLAIMFPEAEFHLIDSRKKKIEATKLIASRLNLENIKITQIRSNELKDKYDFITGRAVTAFPEFHESVKHLINTKDKNALPNGIIYLKGGDFKDEIKDFKHADIINIFDFFEEEYFQTKKIIYLPS